MCRCERKSYNVAAQMCASAGQDLTTERPKCVQVGEKIVQRSSADVCKCKRRSYNGAAQVCAGARENRTT